MDAIRVRGKKLFFSVALAWAAVLLVSCSGGGGGGGSSTTPPTTSHAVTLSWAANREAAVNTTGGGYTVNISGQNPIDVPYVSGALAPTSTTVTLTTGSYTATVIAYSALNGAHSSAPSAAVTINVP